VPFFCSAKRHNLHRAMLHRARIAAWRRTLPNNPLEDLHHRPGFMIRRAHQIAVSVFLEETGELGITNRQYGILFVLKHQPGIDQISVAKLLGLDRSTTGMVVAKLEQAGLMERCVGTSDRRRHSLALTRAGEKTLERLAEPARRAQTRLLSAFTPPERTQFLALLDKLTRAFNDSTRVPLETDRGNGNGNTSPSGSGRIRLAAGSKR
jgi:DNA-binding MarR family transcriptional regulator